MRAFSVISHNKVLAYDDGNMLSYHKGKLYWENLETKQFICNIPIPGRKRIFCSIRIIERLLRLEPRIACKVGNKQFLLSCSGGVYLVNVENSTIKLESRLRPQMNNPLSFTRIVDEEGNVESVLFGEYFSNNEYEEVSIFERRESQWTRVFSFPSGRIYHIHGIVQGKEKGSFFVLTGDSDQESGIWFTKDYFKNIECIAGGNQQFRSCVAFTYKDGIIYATDTPQETNYLYYLHLDGVEWKTEALYEMPGPCIYGTKRKKIMVFATSVEADDTLPSWRYLLSGKLGLGVKDKYTHLIAVNNEGNVEEIGRMKKDLFPMLLFQFGNCMFPDANTNAPIIFTPISVNQYDGKTLLIED